MKNIDSHGHVRGESLYVDDIPTLEGTQYAAVFGAPLAHGTLVKVDVTKALAAPGVCAVLTAADIPGENQIGGIIPDEPLFATGEVHFKGQPIAMVLAASERQAQAARELIEVVIEEKAVVTDPREAAAKGMLIHPPRSFTLGDVDAAWPNCTYCFSGRADSGGQEHLYIETQGAYAWLGENGQIHLCSSTQGPTAAQRTAAKVLNIPMHRIEVDVRRLGGGFGGKEDQATPWAVMAALGTLRTGRPVKLILHRLDDMAMTGKRHPYTSDFKIGLDADYRILAYDVTFYQNSGAAADLSPAVLERTLFHHTNCYYIPNTRATALPCRTHLPPNTAFRGFGGPQGMFVIEAAIATAAEKLGIDRHIIQKRNLMEDGKEFPYGQKAEDCQARPTWEDAESRYDLKNWQDRISRFNKAHYSQKKGLAIMPICFGISFTKTHMNQASALVHVYQDGSVGVSTGAVEMGQGVNTKMAQVAAQTLGIDPSFIKLESTNTSRVANTSPTAASASADLNGKALQQACEAIMRRLLPLAAQELGLPDPKNLRLRQGQVHHDGKPTGMQWQKLVITAYLNRVSLSQQTHYATPDLHFDTSREKGNPFAYHVYGTAAIEVQLDCLRGTYEIEAVRVVHDFGQSMNPIIDLGQTEGGIVQGIGWMTCEDLIYDEAGRLRSNALSTYKVPDLYAAPKTIDVHFLKTPGSELAVFRSKAVGEPPLMYGIGAYFAIREAVRAFNPNVLFPFCAPMTPEKVLLALYEGREALPLASKGESADAAVS